MADRSDARSGRKIGKAAVAATIIGNTMEVFDLVIFAQFAVLIGRTFFPSYSDAGQVMLAVGTYGAGFLLRPLGAFVIGIYADRFGRKSALTLTIWLMALGTGMVAMVPSYETIGIAAPLLVLLARLVSGFSAGGELGAATTYLLEMAPNGRRGLYASWQFASQGLGILAGALSGVALSGLLSQDALQAWGWRIPFMLGTLVAPIGYYIRSQLDETIDARSRHGASGDLLRQLWRNHKFELVWGSLAFVGPTTSSYVISQYMTTYAMTVLKLPASVAMTANLAAGATTVVAALVGGHLADRWGRKAMTVGPEFLLLILIYPAFLLIAASRTIVVLLFAIIVLTSVRMMVSASLASQVPEAFPRNVRTTGLSICYNLGPTIFGGTAQLVVTWLISVTGNPTSPSWYLLGTGTISLVALLMLKARTPGTPLD